MKSVLNQDVINKNSINRYRQNIPEDKDGNI